MPSLVGLGFHPLPPHKNVEFLQRAAMLALQALY